MGVIGDVVNLFTKGTGADPAENQLTAVRDAQAVLDKYYQEAQGYQQPYRQAGERALSTLGDMSQFNMQREDFTPDQFNFEADPGYQFRRNEGMNAINSRASANGGYLSGATLKALSRYNQGFASNEYQNAFGRFNANRNFGYNNFIDSYNRRANEMNNRYSRLGNMANMGYNAAGRLGDLAADMGGATAQNIYNRGDVEANRTARTGWNALGRIGDWGVTQLPFFKGENNSSGNSLGSMGENSAPPAYTNPSSGGMGIGAFLDPALLETIPPIVP